MNFTEPLHLSEYTSELPLSDTELYFNPRSCSRIPMLACIELPLVISE